MPAVAAHHDQISLQFTGYPVNLAVSATKNQMRTVFRNAVSRRKLTQMTPGLIMKLILY